MEKSSSVPSMEAKGHPLNSKEEKKKKRRGKKRGEGKMEEEEGEKDLLRHQHSRGEAGDCAPTSEQLL